jgi:predicted MPP superfamily phosphohydrolase
LRLAPTLFFAATAWGLFEAQWLRRRIVEIEVDGLHADLDGLRILQLTDLHLGTVSQNARTLAKAVDWHEARDLDVLALTGDLVSRPRGEPQLRRALGRLAPRHGAYAVLGNHDVDDTRDPLSGRASLGDLTREGVRLLVDEAETIRIGDAQLCVAGCAPSSRLAPPPSLAAPGADLRLLLAHFPDTALRLEPGVFDLVLSGHMHGGQICVPGPGGKVNLLNPSDPYLEGLFDVRGTRLYVSPGTGTTLVPFRFLARPEATLLVLRRRGSSDPGRPLAAAAPATPAHRAGAAVMADDVRHNSTTRDERAPRTIAPDAPP